MSNALIPAELLQQSKHSNEKALKEVSSSGGFLPYIQVMGSMSGAVKEGKFPMGKFALVDGKVLIDLGKEFNALLIAWRSKAMTYQPDVTSVYDVTSPEFQAIKAKDINAAFGAEYLVWLPDHERLATFFFGNATGRTEIPVVNGYLPSEEKSGAINFKCELVKNEKKKQSWHAAHAYDCEVDIVPPSDWAVLMEQINKFNNPPAPKEQATETSGR